ncbi:T9SS type A sorting domain-containing protein [Aquimarina algiphila]|uniref:T9SS type A sorting domain-containing protein n=1 Tax=Aquimarina algiphila TaxID=2047982 RepID=UPI00232FBF5B|nr:T9SS type A sorting domain-containing protein [Aquimarina algiphila]
MKNQLNKTLILATFIALFCITETYAQYAHKINRQRRYDEVSWLITHNAYNNRTDGPAGFFGCLGGGNQSEGIQKQLRDGVRSFMVDIYRVNGELRLKHGSPNMCMMDAKNFNNIIANWLETHPLDIITLHIEAGPNLRKSGLDDIFFGRRSGYKNISGFIYNHKTFVSVNRPKGSGSDVYPKVEEMLNQKKQLVIFTERNYNSDLYRYEFLHTAQNPYRAGQVNQLFNADKFVVDRGIDHKTILTVNHFAGDAPTYNGDVNKSKDANKDVWAKAVTAWYMFGHKPSIAVDYYNLSNGNKPMNQIDDINKINEVRGRFIDNKDANKHVKAVKTYLAEFKNGAWRKIKNNEHKGRRAEWNLFYSFPARSNDNRAIFFEHPDYTFSPSHIKTGDYDGNNSRTYVVDVTANRKTRSKINDEMPLASENSTTLTITPNPSLDNKLIIAYSLEAKSQISINMYSLTGKLIEPLINTKVLNGNGEFEWRSTKNLKGVYLLKGYIGNQPFSKKVLFK